MLSASQTMARVIEDAMASDAPLTDDNAHIAALCSMMELFLQHGLNPTPPRHASKTAPSRHAGPARGPTGI